MERATISLLLSLAVPACSAFGGSQLLAANIGYWMTWTYTNTSLTITLTANTTGYIGLGFSRGGAMAGADIVTVTSVGGSVSIQDRHGVDWSLPLLDAKQDYVLINGSVSNGQMKATFTRALDTCDPDDIPIKPYTTQLIYSYGTVDASGIPQYHGANRGSVTVYILNSVPPPPSDAGVFNIDLVPGTITLSNTSVTTYWCSVVQFPNVTNKSHIIQMEPVITPGNEDIVHHMLVYKCSSVNLNFTSFDLLSGLDGGNNAACATLLAVWAVGGGSYNFPPNAGLPIGGSGSPQYVLIQTHYSNMMLTTGRRDASYIRFRATQNLRQYDAGILQTGVIYGIIVPPNVTQMLVSGYCTSNCLSDANIPATGINIFSVLLHSHLLGRRITFRNIRLTPTPQIYVIADDPYYNFDYQQIWNLDTLYRVLPGDILQTVCTMSSTSRSVATQGGIGTYQEMCLSFAFYYPAINLTNCQTFPPFTVTESDPLYQMVGRNISSFNWFGQSSNSNDAIAGANWSTQAIQAAQAEYFSGPNGDYCQTGETGYSGLSFLPELAATSLPNASALSPACYQTTASATTLSASSAGATTAGGSTALVTVRGGSAIFANNKLTHHVTLIGLLGLLLAAYT